MMAWFASFFKEENPRTNRCRPVQNTMTGECASFPIDADLPPGWVEIPECRHPKTVLVDDKEKNHQEIFCICCGQTVDKVSAGMRKKVLRNRRKVRK